MNKSVTMNIKGLQCDTQGCDYRDDNVDVENYAQYVNAPCPKCGGNLLTKADYALVQLLLDTTEVLNDLFPAETFPADEPKVSLSIKMDGSGVPIVG